MTMHVHIVGCSPRSGTSLIHQMIKTCFNNVDACAHEMSFFKSETLCGDIVCTKSPREIPYVSWLLRLNPNLYVIYMVRDPRDVVVSQHKKSGNNYYSNLDIWESSEAIRSKLNGRERFFSIKYEDLVSNPNSVQRLLVDKMPFLKAKCKFSEFHQYAETDQGTLLAMNGIRPVTSDSVGRWRNHLPRLNAQLETSDNISEALISLGYEADTKWEDCLDGVSSAYSESEIDGYTPYNSVKFKYRVFRKVLENMISKILLR